MPFKGINRYARHKIEEAKEDFFHCPVCKKHTTFRWIVPGSFWRCLTCGERRV